MDNSEVSLEKTFKESSKSVFCLGGFDELTSNGFLEQSSQPARVIINLLVKPKPWCRTASVMSSLYLQISQLYLLTIFHSFICICILFQQVASVVAKCAFKTEKNDFRDLTGKLF